MKRFFILFLLFIAWSSVQAADSKLVLVLGHVEEFQIRPAERLSSEDSDQFNLDHTCGYVKVKFSVEEYLAGKGPNQIEVSKRLSFGQCQPSWNTSRAIAVISDFGNFRILRNIVAVHGTEKEAYLLYGAPKFLREVGPVDFDRLFQPIETVIEGKVEGFWNPNDGSYDLDWLKSIGFLNYKFAQSNIDLSCRSNCKEGPFFPVIDLEYLKVIPISAIRNYGF